MTYTVTNTFHNTEAKTTLSEKEYHQAGYPEDSKAQRSINRRARALDKKLCGMSDCVCYGGTWSND